MALGKRSDFDSDSIYFVSTKSQVKVKQPVGTYWTGEKETPAWERRVNDVGQNYGTERIR